MKIRAFAVCVTSLLVAGAALAQNDHGSTSMPGGARSDMNRSDRMRDHDRYRDRDRDRDRGDYAHYWSRPGDRDRDPDYLRFTPPPSLHEEAGKVADIVTANRLEAAELRTMGGTAQTAGWENIHSIYMDMAPDHERVATVGEDWLRNYGFNVRTETTTTTTTGSISPEGSVDAMMQHHEMVFNDMLNKAHAEDSLFVRGMELLTAATAARHLSELRWLNRNVDMGTKTMTADLEGFLSNSQVAGSRQSTDMHH
jgi:hypothetical protein